MSRWFGSTPQNGVWDGPSFWGASTWGDFTWFDPSLGPQGDPHGIHILIGPPGSGKTLLLVHCMRPYAMGLVRDPVTGGCLCGKPDCHKEWTAYTNIKSTWIDGPNPKGWALPLDVAHQLRDPEGELDHIVIGVDEIHLYLDARAFMGQGNRRATKVLSQLRKGDVKLFGTTQRFGDVDVRVRDRTAAVYNCWTPDRGRHVNATVQQIAVGHLPPWERESLRPQIRSWDTEGDRPYYHTGEVIAGEEAEAQGNDPVIMVPNEDPEGEPMMVPIRNLVSNLLNHAIQRRQYTITVEEILQQLSEGFGWQGSAAQVRSWMAESGFQGHYEAGKLVYQIGADVPAALMEVG